MTLKSIFVGVLAVSGLLADSAIAQEASNDQRFVQEPLAPLSFLLGTCWQGDIKETNGTDTHCYEASFNGTMVVDRHLVTGGERDYCGEMRFNIAPPLNETEEPGILFRYHNIFGAVSEGILERNGRNFEFPEERFEDRNGNEIAVKTRFLPISDKAYKVVTLEQRGRVWQAVQEVRFNKVALNTYPNPTGFQACSK